MGSSGYPKYEKLGILTASHTHMTTAKKDWTSLVLPRTPDKS